MTFSTRSSFGETAPLRNEGVFFEAAEDAGKAKCAQ